MNGPQLSMFDDDLPIVPGPEERVAPRSPLERLDLMSFVRKSDNEEATHPIMRQVWRAPVNGLTMCFVVGSTMVFGVESRDAPGAHDLDLTSQGAGSAINYLTDVVAENHYSRAFNRQDITRFGEWCGKAEWPREGLPCPPPRLGELSQYPGQVINRNTIAQMIETLGDFYNCDTLLRHIINLPKGPALLLRGFRDDGGPGWRAFIMGYKPSPTEKIEVFS